MPNPAGREWQPDESDDRPAWTDESIPSWGRGLTTASTPRPSRAAGASFSQAFGAAGEGGAIYAQADLVTLFDSTLVGNQSLGGWGFGFGYHAHENFTAGFLFSWRSVNYDAKVVRADNPEQIDRYSNFLDVGTVALTAEWNMLKKSITPYVNGAVGWTMLDTNVYAGSGGSYCWWDPWYGYICDTYANTYGTDAASYVVGAGLRWELSEVVFLRGGYEHGWIDVDKAVGFDMFRLDIGLMY